MQLTLNDIRSKEVVNLKDGVCFGYADDIILETETKSVVAIVIRGRLRFFGILGRENDIIIDWEDIETIGEDTILVKIDSEYSEKPQKFNIIEKIFGYF